MNTRLHHYDAIVIGAGLSGLLAAAALVQEGARVAVIAKGGGYLHFVSGCIDVLQGDASSESPTSPLQAFDALTRHDVRHPYALSGRDALEKGTALFLRIMEEKEHPFVGTLELNVSLPTAIGSTRTSCLVPTGMAAGDLSRSDSTLIVGFSHFRDFYPPYCAANLAAIMPFPVHSHYLDLEAFRDRRHLLSLDVARALEDASIVHEIGRKVRATLGDAVRVGFPAVLGVRKAHETLTRLSNAIGVPVFEIPILPPSVPGIRIDRALRTWLTQRGVRVEIGFWVRGGIGRGRVTEISVASAGRDTRYGADAVILATGGTGGGGIKAASDGCLHETVFDLPVEGPRDRTEWFRPEFLGPQAQPISLVGIRTDESLRPLDVSGRPVDNLFVTASNLPGWDPTREKSGEGVALATGWKAAHGALQFLGGRETSHVYAAQAGSAKHAVGGRPILSTMGKTGGERREKA